MAISTTEQGATPARYPGDGVRDLTVQTIPEDATYLPLREQWVSGEGGGVTFVLDTTQGLGGAVMILSVTMADGTVKRERIDMRKVLPDWITAMVRAHEEAQA